MSKAFPARWGLALLGVAAALAYWPGLRSGYYLDDFYNLYRLAEVGTSGYGPFVFGGVAGPTGRPLALLSFALQHEAWPGDPFRFKAVNLALHLLNGLLVFFIARRLARPFVDGPARAEWLAFLATAVWLLHPMQQSTVLYTVQRMTELSALFMLLGVSGYLCGRNMLAAGKKGGYAVMTVSLGLGTVLATLSKENGALLPLLVVVLEATLLRAVPVRMHPAWKLIVLVLPAAAVPAYLAYTFPGAIRGFSDRTYGMGEKVLTEAAVLWCYLFDLFAPRPGAFGLFHDDFPLARGILDPWYTLPAVLGVAVLLGGGFVLRRRAPVPAFAVLWFFAGHLLESTHIDLELYFEHRNYVPSFGVAFLLAWAVVQVAAKLGWRIAAGAAGAYVALLALITLQNAALWSNPLAEAYEAVRNHPRSFSANAQLGNRLLGAGRVEEAREQFVVMAQRFPDLMYPRLKVVGVHGCVLDEPVGDAFWEETIPFAARARAIRFEVAAELDALIGAIAVGDCDAVDAARLLALVETLADNPRFAASRAMLLELAANLSLHLQEWERAHAHMLHATRLKPTVERRLRLVTIEYHLGLAEEARRNLERLEANLGWRPALRAGYAERIDGLRRALSGAGPASR